MITCRLAIIGNKYFDSINTATDLEAVGSAMGIYSQTEFESKVIEILKISNLELIILDTTCINDDSKILECVRYLKMMMKPETRLIVLWPNLKDEAFIQQLLVYGVYDLLNPELDENTMDDLEIANKVIADIQYCVSNPVSFADVVDNLNVSIITQNIIEASPETYTYPELEEKSEIEKKQETKPSRNKKVFSFKKEKTKQRLVGFYTDSEAIFDKIKASDRYNVIDLKNILFSTVADEIDYDSVDVVVMADINAETVKYVSSLVAVSEHKPLIIAGYKDIEAIKDLPNIDYLKSFNYDGTTDAFARNVSIAIAKIDEEIIKSNKNTKVFAVYGVKGGVGSTTIASLMAKEYAKKHPTERVMICDFSLRAGTLAERWGIDTPNPNLFEAVSKFAQAKQNHIDISQLKDKLDAYCHYDNKSGVYVLPTPYNDIYHYTNYQFNSELLLYIYSYLLECFKETYDAIFLDVTKFGGFSYDIAVENATKIILVSDAKLSSCSLLLQKIDELSDKITSVNVVMNRCDIKHNEREYENYSAVIESIDKSKVAIVPFDKKMFNEEVELQLIPSKGTIKAVEDVWNVIYPTPKTKRKLF